MNLLGIRKQFRDISGRYDLVNDDFSDNGCDVYINEGSRWLDRNVNVGKRKASHMTLMAAGDWYTEISTTRSVKEVWLTTTEGKWLPTKIHLKELINSFFTAIPANWTNGTPIAYALGLSRYLPADIDAGDLAIMQALTGMVNSSGDDYDAIIFSCPVDVQTLVEVIGDFYSPSLVEDDDTNFWSSVHPLLLVNASIRQTFVASGNTPMLKTFNDAIAQDLKTLEMDTVESEIAGVNQMNDTDYLVD